MGRVCAGLCGRDAVSRQGASRKDLLNVPFRSDQRPVLHTSSKTSTLKRFYFGEGDAADALLIFKTFCRIVFI